MTGRLRVSAGRDSNSVIVAGPPEVLGIVGEIVRRLDQAAPAVSESVRLLPLEHARAEEVAATMTRMLEKISKF